MRNRCFFYFPARIKGQAETVRRAARPPFSALPRPARRNGDAEQPDPPAFRLIDDLRKLWRGSALPRLLGLSGGAVLAAGAAAPLIHIPIAGTISYLQHPNYFSSCNIGELVILAAAGLSIVFALLKWFKPLWLTGTIALAQLIATLAIFQHSAAAVVAKADQPDLVDPMLMWASAALLHARLEWGIAVIGAGAAMLLAAAACEVGKGRRDDKHSR
jgi:hypothetical protein